MTTPHHPPAQPSLEQSPETILLPPVPRAVTTTSIDSGQERGWDRLLIVLVLALAFLTASFFARNSDLWFHLATGRMLAERQFSFGAEPFAYTTEGAYWACHSWLTDLAAYEFYSLLGGTGLVVLKALLVTGLAGLLLLVRRPGSSAWAPVACTTLALLAMAPRLQLQPTCVSYLFLAV